MYYQNTRSALFGFVTKHAGDRETDGQNCDSQDRASIDASRGKIFYSRNKHKIADERLEEARTDLSQSLAGAEAMCVLTSGN